MKKILLFIFILLFLAGYSQDVKRIRIKIENKETVILDSVKFLVENRTNDTLKVYFSLYVRVDNDRKELYNDIYNKDREILKKILVTPKARRNFSYAINNIHPLFKERIGNYPLRIEMVGFYKEFRRGLYRIHTAPFQIKK